MCVCACACVWVDVGPQGRGQPLFAAGSPSICPRGPFVLGAQQHAQDAQRPPSHTIKCDSGFVLVLFLPSGGPAAAQRAPSHTNLCDSGPCLCNCPRPWGASAAQRPPRHTDVCGSGSCPRPCSRTMGAPQPQPRVRQTHGSARSYRWEPSKWRGASGVVAPVAAARCEGRASY